MTVAVACACSSVALHSAVTLKTSLFLDGVLSCCRLLMQAFSSVSQQYSQTPFLLHVPTTKGWNSATFAVVMYIVCLLLFHLLNVDKLLSHLYTLTSLPASHVLLGEALVSCTLYEPQEVQSSWQQLLCDKWACVGLLLRVPHLMAHSMRSKLTVQRGLLAN